MIRRDGVRVIGKVTRVRWQPSVLHMATVMTQISIFFFTPLHAHAQLTLQQRDGTTVRDHTH
jgi:hypothetical protein